MIDDVRRFEDRADGYLRNFWEFYRRREYPKAGELLWGAYAQVVKATAARRGIPVRSHERLRRFARDIARDLGHPLTTKGWRDDFTVVETFHQRFYEGDPDPRMLARLANSLPAWRREIRALQAAFQS